MNFKELIGKYLSEVPINTDSLEIERNDFELELEEGLPEKWYATAKDSSFEMILNSDKKIETIFLYHDDYGNFRFNNYNINFGRTKIRELMGKPDREGEPILNSIIGESGGFDRFDREIVYHFEYKDKNQKILKKITLMSLDTAP